MMKKLGVLLLAAAMAGMVFTGCSQANASVPSSGADQGADENGFDSSNEISVITREDGSGTRGAFTELFGVEIKGEDGSKTDLTSAEAITANSTSVVMTNVANDEFAIGYVSLGSLNNTVKPVKIDGTEASAENVKNGSYQAARPFNIATKGEAEGLAKDFIDFILSKEGQEVVSDAYISINDTAASYAGSKPEGKLVIAGSSSVAPVMEKLIEAYQKVNTNASIELQTSDSTAGMTAVKDGTCDIGMASRELKDSEKSELTGFPIALDGIAVVINPQNPLNELSKEQVKSIFTGEVIVWSDILD